jgi:hypothetical protein
VKLGLPWGTKPRLILAHLNAEALRRDLEGTCKKFAPIVSTYKGGDCGQRMGRPPKLTPHQKREAIRRRDTGDETLADIGRSYNVSPATISRLMA